MHCSWGPCQLYGSMIQSSLGGARHVKEEGQGETAQAYQCIKLGGFFAPGCMTLRHIRHFITHSLSL